jgi:hypothetical protein
MNVKVPNPIGELVRKPSRLDPAGLVRHELFMTGTVREEAIAVLLLACVMSLPRVSLCLNSTTRCTLNESCSGPEYTVVSVSIRVKRGLWYLN